MRDVRELGLTYCVVRASERLVVVASPRWGERRVPFWVVGRLCGRLLALELGGRVDPAPISLVAADTSARPHQVEPAIAYLWREESIEFTRGLGSPIASIHLSRVQDVRVRLETLWRSNSGK